MPTYTVYVAPMIDLSTVVRIGTKSRLRKHYQKYEYGPLWPVYLSGWTPKEGGGGVMGSKSLCILKESPVQGYSVHTLVSLYIHNL